MNRNNFGLMIALTAGTLASPAVFELKTSEGIARARASGYLPTNYRHHTGEGSGLRKPIKARRKANKLARANCKLNNRRKK